MTKQELDEIRARHESDADALAGSGDVDYVRPSQAHIDRGLLLEALERLLPAEPASNLTEGSQRHAPKPESGLRPISPPPAGEPSGEFQRGVKVGQAIESAEGCICRGNWREIVRETTPLIGKRFRDDRNGLDYHFFGVVHGDDDYYYGMYRAGDLRLLSCVGSIKGHGFTMLGSAARTT